MQLTCMFRKQYLGDFKKVCCLFYNPNITPSRSPRTSKLVIIKYMLFNTCTGLNWIEDW